MVEFFGIILVGLFVWNIIYQANSEVTKYREKKESRRKQKIFSPEFEKYYPKIQSLHTISALESYKQALPAPNSHEIRRLEAQTGRNIIIEAGKWIDERIEKIREKNREEEEQKRREDRDKKEKQNWVNTKNKLEVSKGFVYILSNPSMPNIVKIGYSTKQPHERASELYTTGVPTPFNVLYSWGTKTESKAVSLEKNIHTKFEQYRIHGNREFFQDDCLHRIRKYIEAEIGSPI